MSTSPKLIMALIILLGLAGGYLFYSRLLTDPEPVRPPPIDDRDTLRTFQNLKIDFAVLQHAVYKSLTIYGQAPVNPGVTGKKDLFAPF